MPGLLDMGPYANWDPEKDPYLKRYAPGQEQESGFPWLLAAPEMAVTMATGLGTMPFAGNAGLLATGADGEGRQLPMGIRMPDGKWYPSVVGNEPATPADIVERIMEKGTFMPRSAVAQEGMQRLGGALEPVVESFNQLADLGIEKGTELGLPAGVIGGILAGLLGAAETTPVGRGGATARAAGRTAEIAARQSDMGLLRDVLRQAEANDPNVGLAIQATLEGRPLPAPDPSLVNRSGIRPATDAEVRALMDMEFGSARRMRDVAANDSPLIPIPETGPGGVPIGQTSRGARQRGGPKDGMPNGVNDLYYTSSIYGDKRRLEVLKNPTDRQLARWGKENNDPYVRWAHDSNGDLYIWNGEDALHLEIMERIDPGWENKIPWDQQARYTAEQPLLSELKDTTMFKESVARNAGELPGPLGTRGAAPGSNKAREYWTADDWHEAGRWDGKVQTSGDAMVGAPPLSKAQERAYWEGVLDGADELGAPSTAAVARRQLDNLDAPGGLLSAMDDPGVLDRDVAMRDASVAARNKTSQKDVDMLMHDKNWLERQRNEEAATLDDYMSDLEKRTNYSNQADTPWIGIIDKEGNAEFKNYAAGVEADWHHSLALSEDGIEAWGSDDTLRFVREFDENGSPGNALVIGGNAILDPRGAGEQQIRELARQLKESGVPGDFELKGQQMWMNTPYEGRSLGTIDDWLPNAPLAGDRITPSGRAPRTAKTGPVPRPGDVIRTEDGFRFEVKPDGTVTDGDMYWESVREFADAMADDPNGAIGWEVVPFSGGPGGKQRGAIRDTGAGKKIAKTQATRAGLLQNEYMPDDDYVKEYLQNAYAEGMDIDDMITELRSRSMRDPDDPSNLFNENLIKKIQEHGPVSTYFQVGDLGEFELDPLPGGKWAMTDLNTGDVFELDNIKQSNEVLASIRSFDKYQRGIPDDDPVDPLIAMNKIMDKQDVTPQPGLLAGPNEPKFRGDPGQEFYQGPAYRYTEGFEGGAPGGATARDVIDEEMQRKGFDTLEEFGIDQKTYDSLADVPAEELMWVGRDRDVLFSEYGPTENWEGFVESVDDFTDVTDAAAGGRILHESPDGTLILRKPRTRDPWSGPGKNQAGAVRDTGAGVELLRTIAPREGILNISRTSRETPLSVGVGVREGLFDVSGPGTGARGQVTKYDAARTLEYLHGGLLGRQIADPTTTRGMNNMIARGADDVGFQLEQPVTGQGWYDEDIGRTFSLLEEHFSPMYADPDVQTLWTGVAAPTSYGTPVPSNARVATSIMQHYLDNGRIPSINPETGKLWTMRPTSREGLELTQHLLDRFGPQGYSEFMLTPHSIRDLAQIRKESGVYKGGRPLTSYKNVAGNLDDMRYGAYILGEKGGPFMLNLNDIKDTTVDLWQMRNYGRSMGRILHPTTGELIDAPISPAMRNQAKQYTRGVADRFNLSEQDTQAIQWYFEQQLYDQMGVRGAIPQSFSEGVESLMNRQGLLQR